MPRSSRPFRIAGNSVKAIVPSADVSIGQTKNSPPGMLPVPASTSVRLPATDTRRSVPRATIRASSAPSKSCARREMRSCRAFQSIRQEP